MISNEDADLGIKPGSILWRENTHKQHFPFNPTPLSCKLALTSRGVTSEPVKSSKGFSRI